MKLGWILLLFTAISTGGALAAPPPIRIVTLDNGVRVVLAPDPDARTADVAVWYATGVRDEPKGRSGLTHLVERMALRGGVGADDPGDIRRRLEAEGGLVNTYSTDDFTSLYATVPSSQVETALELLAQRFAAPHFTAADLEAERGFVRREQLAFLEGNPVGHGIELLYGAAFPGHGYGRPVIGREADLAHITLDDATGFVRRGYVGARAVVTVVGRFDPEPALAAARRAFGALPRGEAASAPEPFAAPVGHVRERYAGPVPLLLVGWRAPAGADSATVALDLLARLMGSGALGRFSRDLSNNPVFAQAGAAFDPHTDASLFYAFAALRSPKDSVDAEKTFADAVELLGSQAVAAEELDRVKHEWELEWNTDRQEARERDRDLGTALMVDGDADAHLHQLDRVRRITPAELQAVAKRVLVPSARCAVVMMPSPSAAAGAPARGAAPVSRHPRTTARTAPRNPRGGR
jgi:zinc protease